MGKINIGLLSDTHSFIDPAVYKYFDSCDEIWHAGDLGDAELINTLENFKPTRGVYGNIDGIKVRSQWPEILQFEIEGLKVLIKHIGGYPYRYAKGVKQELLDYQPDLFISGHSHILKIMPDKSLNLLHINPGAAGNNGFHQIKTLVRFGVLNGKITDLQVIEIGKRGQ